MFVDQAIENFLFHCKYEKNLAMKTLSAYCSDLTQFKTYVLGKLNIRQIHEVDKHTLRGYLKYLSDLASPKTVKRKFATLSALFRFLELEDDIVVSPLRKMQVRISLEQRLPIVLNLAEVQQLWRYLYAQAAGVGVDPNPRRRLLLRDLAIFEMFFVTGMRVAELTALRQDHVDLEEGIVRVFGKGRKERLVPICDASVLRIFKRYRRTHPQGASHFFLNYKGGSMTEEAVRSIVKKHSAKSGLPKKVTPHTLRHTTATLLLENGVDLRYIQKLLGHSNITTTQIYAAVNTPAQRAVLAKHHPRRHLQF